MFATPIGSLFDGFFGEFMSPQRWTPRIDRFADEAPAVMRPRRDVIDKGSAHEVVVDLPGVRKEDISVAIEGDWVTGNAEAKGEASARTATGCSTANAGRAPARAASSCRAKSPKNGADAKFENGVLRLPLPKREPTAVKRLTVH